MKSGVLYMQIRAYVLRIIPLQAFWRASASSTGEKWSGVMRVAIVKLLNFQYRDDDICEVDPPNGHSIYKSSSASKLTPAHVIHVWSTSLFLSMFGRYFYVKNRH